MSRGVNKAIIVGTLGQDPEIRYAANGNAVVNVSVATNESWKDRQTGEKQERVQWHRIVMFGKLGEIAHQYLKKGSQAYFEGSIKTRKWLDQAGNNRYTTEVVANEMQMLGGGANTGTHGRAQGEQRRPQQQEAPMDRDGVSTAPMDDGFDSIPF